MVGAFSLLGSPVMDSAHTCPCLCLGTMSSSSMSLKSSGEIGLNMISMGRKQSKQVGSLKLTSSFVGSGKELLGVVKKTSRKQHKVQRTMIVNEVGGQYEDTFQDVKKNLITYFTYKAVKTILAELYEKDRAQYTWLYNFVATNNPGAGRLLIRNLGPDKRDLAQRIMQLRLHLYGKWIKKCNHGEIYHAIADDNLELMRERLMDTVAWPPKDDTKK